MRKLVVAGNWKMNTTVQEGVELAQAINKLASEMDKNVEVVICPPFVHISEVIKAVGGGRIQVGAQDCSAQTAGAYTGEISAAMLKSIGADYVILGHSERRQYHGENGEILTAKIKQALANGLKVMYCIGENLDERESGKYVEVVKTQIEEVLFAFTEEELKSIVLAYEPVWAIGTGKTASPEQAQEIHKEIRDIVATKYGAEVANEVSILYGGSCKPSNAQEIFANPDVDGGLIGGAALKAEDFLGIINGFKA